jgi:hypothetical protein
MARKGDLKPTWHINVGVDESLQKVLLEAAARNERKITQEIRFALRSHYGLNRAPAEDMEVQAGVGV